jgi:hypothetical protein
VEIKWTHFLSAGVRNELIMARNWSVPVSTCAGRGVSLFSSLCWAEFASLSSSES